MKLWVIGYYGKNNLGDEQYRLSIPLSFPNCHFHFYPWKTENSIDEATRKHASCYDALMVGGGDLINDFFKKNLLEWCQIFSGKPIFAFSLGVPYPSLLKEWTRLWNGFDFIFLRNRTDLKVLQKRFGTEKAHFLPDSGFFLAQQWQRQQQKVDPKEHHQKTRKIGITVIPALLERRNLLDAFISSLDTPLLPEKNFHKPQKNDFILL